MKIIIKADTFTQTIMGTGELSDFRYRLFKYVLKQKCDGGVLLYNVLSCEMLYLTKEEWDERSENEILIRKWFLVPEVFEDFSFAKKVKRIRQLVYKTDTRKKLTAPIDRFWILTTTACNARCFYCFEKRMPGSDMTMETASRAIEYIQEQADGELIKIIWFGGEPLFNYPVIVEHRFLM